MAELNSSHAQWQQVKGVAGACRFTAQPVALVMVLCALLGAAGPASAQVDLDKAALTGTVRDNTGAVLPGAVVTVTNPSTGFVRRTTVDEEGVYRLAALAPGSYEVRAEHTGFASKVFPSVVLTIGQRAELDVVLEVPRFETTIVVEAEVSSIEPRRVGQVSTLSQTEIERLPIDQRNFLGFALLTPGTTGANPLAAPTPTNSPTSGLSIAGQDPRSNNVMIDGTDNMDAAVNSVRSTLSQDAVQEFQVLRSTFSAEFGRARGGVVNIVSKSGTNAWRSGGFLFFRDDTLDARNRFAYDLNGNAANPPFRRYQYGATLGGPLVRDRSFVFASYEGLRRRESAFVSVLQSDQILRATPSQQRLFDALARVGDPRLSNIAALFTDPLTGLLNTTRATFPSTLDLLQRESGIFPFASDSHTLSVRLDVNLSTTNSLIGRVNFNDLQADGNDVGGLRGISSSTSNATRNFAAVMSNTHVLSSDSVNILRAQYSRFRTTVLPRDPLGPGLVIAGIAQVGRDLFNPTDYAWNIVQVGDTFLRSVGRHEIKVGGDVLHMRSNDAVAEVFLAGQFQFAEVIPLAAVLDAVLGPGTATLVAGQLGGSAVGDLLSPITALQSFNFGLPVAFLQGFGDPTTDITYTQLAAFAQDDIRLGRNATLSLGIRYDTDWRDESVNTANTAPPFTLRHSVIADRNNVAPRVGFAYTLGAARRTVLRGGFGVFYQNAPTVSGFISRVLSGQISQVFLPLTGLPGVTTATSADVWRLYRQQGRVSSDTLVALGVTPGTTPSVLLTGREHTPNPSSTHASAGAEYEAASNIALAAEYTYNRGRNLIRTRDINVRATGPNTFELPGLDPRFLQLNVLEPTGRSSYHGLSLSIRKRFTRGWSLLSSYTLARAMDDVSDFTLDNEPEDQTRPEAEWGPSNYDQRHRVVASAVFYSPDSAKRWIANWSVAPIVTFASGRPFNLLLGFDANGDVHTDTDRARTASGESVSRNSGVGPSFLTTDLRFARQVRLGADARLEFTLEVFNLFNRTNFSGINRIFGNQPAPSGTAGGRADLPPTQPLGFTAAHPARQMQLGARVQF
jgi:opacity protein-like surface antigen